MYVFESRGRSPTDWIQQYSLPSLQSVVIVLLKAVLANVTALITQPLQSGVNGSSTSAYPPEVNQRATNGSGEYGRELPTHVPSTSPDMPDMAVEDLDAIRSREISAKAVSGVLILLLKWFKVSRKFLDRWLKGDWSTSSRDLIICRRPQVRVFDTATPRFELPPSCPKALCAPRV